MNIVFMGSPDFAVPSLQALIKSKHKVVGVFSQPPRPAGRGKKLTSTPIHKLAEEKNIPVFTPEKLNPEAIERLKALSPNIIAVAAYGLIVPEDVLNIAPCLNIHPSCLPRWRGAAPIQRTLLAGDTKIDLCIMQMEKGLDTGPVYLRVPYTVGGNETSGELTERMATEGATHLLEVINNWEQYKNNSIPQDGETIYAHKFKPEELKEIRKINWHKSSKEVHNQIRGLSPWPSATAHIHNTDIKIIRSEKITGTGKAGEILNISSNGITIACKEGAVLLKELQRPGKAVMIFSEFLKGFPLKVGEIFQ